MASRSAHVATGWAAGVMAAAVVIHAHAQGPFYIWAILSMIAGISGGGAPDWLERSFWSRKRKLWCKHRTICHWGVAWLGLLYWTYTSLGEHPAAAVGLGFAAGGVVHLLIDWPNYMGVPWLYKRTSLNLWASGECDYIVIGAAWIAAALVCDAALFDSIYVMQALSFIRDLPAFS